MFPALATVASPPEWAAERTLLVARIAELERQVAWFQRQLFGEKSERRHIDPPPAQMALGEGLGDTAPATLAPQPVAAHQRQRAAKAQDEGTEPALFFDPERVPVETINVPNPTIAGLPAEAYAVIGEKVTHRLAQRPGSYVVLKYVRALVKVKDTAALSCPPAPASVLEGGRADVSCLAGLIVDKFLYHLPLYRQHQRLLAAGVEVSRQWLTQQVLAVALLLAPIVAAQLAGIRACRVKAMDETPIKAGRQGPGKLHQGYFWPIWGDTDEGRRRDRLSLPALACGHPCARGARGQSGGRRGAAHRRLRRLRAVGRAHRHRPRPVLDTHPTHLRAGQGHRAGGQRRGPGAHRRPLPHRDRDPRAGSDRRGQARLPPRPRQAPGHAFFEWAQAQVERAALLPSNPLTKALHDALERREALSVYLDDPEVPIDTNHLERALRPIPMGRKAWLFCWSEVGAEAVATLQSLMVTCRLHDIDPYDYLIDVLQRIDRHPAREVHLLTPRLWQQHFAADPLRSDLQRLPG